MGETRSPNFSGKMGERHALLSWGCLASDLVAVGAGSRGWLDDRGLIVTMGRGLVALAKQRTLVVTAWSGAGIGTSTSHQVGPGFTTVVPCGPDASEHITALEWLLWEGWSALAVGTSMSVLCIYSESGQLLIKQSLNVGSITHLHARSNYAQAQDPAEELSIAFQTSFARIDALDLQSQLRRRLQEAGNYASARWLADAESTKLPFQMWSIKASGTSTCTDAAITGVLPPSLFEQQSRQRYFCAISVGADSTFAAFRLSEDRRQSLSDLLFSKVVPATVSTISSLARVFRRSEAAPEARPTDVKPREFSRASLITALRDPPRRGESLALSPSRSLAAVTDSLGRVLLIDVHALVVVRIWKGYRDAQCKFLEAPLNGVAGLQTSQRCRKEDFCLCLAIHAPRRGTVEVWKMRNGPRLSVIRCAENCRLLQPPSKFWTAATHDSSSSYMPQFAYVLSGDSSLLSVINPFLPSSASS